MDAAPLIHAAGEGLEASRAARDHLERPGVSVVPGLPSGAFGVISEQETVGRKDFINGNAQFVFIPAET